MSSARLEELRTLVAEHGSASLSAWFEAGLVRREDGETLDEALELSGTRATIERDVAIRRAAQLLDPEGCKKRWVLAGDIAVLIQRFEAWRWRRLRHLRCPELSPVNRAIFDAMKAAHTANQRMVSSQRTVYRIIR